MHEQILNVFVIVMVAIVGSEKLKQVLLFVLLRYLLQMLHTFQIPQKMYNSHKYCDERISCEILWQWAHVLTRHLNNLNILVKKYINKVPVKALSCPD